MRTLPILIGILVVSLAACGDSDGSPGKGGSSASAAAETYTVRGVIHGITGDQVSVQHEAIPAFKDRDGQASEMMSMTMNFGLAEGIDRSTIKPDTKVSMTFDVVWDRRPALRATKLEVLPADTTLKL